MSIDISKLSFKYRASPDLDTKIERFSSAGSTAHLVLDFDRTLTIAKNSSIEATSWQIMEHQMASNGKAEYAELFKKYRQNEVDRTLTPQLAEEWWNKSLSLLPKYGVNLRKVEKTFLDTVTLRPGVKELFDIATQREMPTVILSAGVKDIIDIVLIQNGIKPPLVISTELITNTEGVIIGWIPETVVHVLNKNEVKHDELDKIRKNRPLSIIIGDSLDDANMAAGDDDVLRIRVIDPRPDEDLESTLAKTFDTFDLAIVDGNLHDVVKIIEAMTT